MKSNIYKIVILIFSLAGLVGCGEDRAFTDTGTGTTTTQTTTTGGGVIVTADDVSTINLITGKLSARLTVSTPTVSSSDTINATVLDSAGLAVADGTVVLFELDGTGTLTGGVTSLTAATIGGVASVTLTAPKLVGGTRIIASIPSANKSSTLDMTYVPAAPATVGLSASPATVGTGATSALFATLRDASGNLTPNQAVFFAITANNSGAKLSPSAAIAYTNDNGVAGLDYIAGAAAGTDTVRASTGTIFGETNISVSSSSASVASVALSTGTLSTNLKVSTLTAASTDTIKASVTDTAGQLAANGTTVFFELTGTGKLTGGVKSIQATTTNGVASVTLTAPLLVGSGTVTATAGDKSDNIPMTYIPEAATVVSLSASPATVGIASLSTLSATVRDANGNVIEGEQILFNIPTNKSGATLNPATGFAVTNANGVATMSYLSGATPTTTIPDTVRVTIGTTASTVADGNTSATDDVADADISVSASTADVQSVTLTTASISTNLKVSSTTTASIETIEATVKDTNGNLVADGTTVFFELSGTGKLSSLVAGSTIIDVTSLTATTVSGVAKVKLTAPLLVGSGTIRATIAGKSDTIPMTYIPEAATVVSLSASPATVGIASLSTLSATVRDANGNVIEGEQVIFSIPTNKSVATLDPATGFAVTNANGVATMSYLSGATPTTTIPDTVRVTIGTTASTVPDGNTSATDDVADADISVSAGTADVQSVTLTTASISTNLKVSTTTTASIETIEATVKDTNGNLVADGTTVFFELSGTGKLSSLVAGSTIIDVTSLTATTVSGVAKVKMTAPLLVGSGTIRATIAGKSDTKTITYIPEAATVVSLSASPATVGIASLSTLSATVRDANGNVIEGEQVIFSIPTNKSVATLDPATGFAVTNANGVATMSYLSGATPTTTIPDTVRVTIGTTASTVPDGNTSATDDVADVDISVSASTADIQSVTLATASLSDKLVVSSTTTASIETIEATVKDTNGNLVANGTIVFFELSGTGKLSSLVAGSTIIDVTSLTATTDSGVAKVTLTAPLLVGSGIISASVGGKSATKPITYLPEAPTVVSLSVSPTTVETSNTSTLTATVRDANGNLVPYADVTFSIFAGGGALENGTGSAITDLNGMATMGYIAGASAGTDTARVTIGTAADTTADVSTVATADDVNISVSAEPVATKLTIRTDTTTIPSDNFSGATITVTALNSANVVAPNTTINFSADGGLLSAGSLVTDANGEAVVTLKAGTDISSTVILVTASSPNVITSLTIPVEVIGSTVVIDATRNVLIWDDPAANTSELTVTVTDSAAVGIYGVPITLTAVATATYSFTPPSGKTDVNGQFKATLTGLSAGDVNVTADTGGVQKSRSFTVSGLTESLRISAPVSGSTAAIGQPQPVTVEVPATVASVTLISTLGTWDSSGTGVLTVANPTPGTAATVVENITSAEIGNATIRGSDAANSSMYDEVQLIFVDEVVDSLSNVGLQASPTTVAPSVGSTKNSSLLDISVTNGAGTGIANAMVTLQMSNTTGSGEYVEPGVVYTDASGKATATFYSGSASSGSGGVRVTASLDATKTGLPAKSDFVDMIVNGTASSIQLSPSTKLISSYSDTMYKLPMTLLVADSNGSGVPNAVVTLNLWPEQYALGYRNCANVTIVAILPNEDIERDLDLSNSPGDDVSGDGYLTPANSSGGSVPPTVTTDESGVAQFELLYPKGSADFVYDALSATTLVQGTETRATSRFWLGATETDVNGCWLPPVSPFNGAWLTLSALANPDTVLSGLTLTGIAGQPGNSANITASLLAPDGTALARAVDVHAVFMVQASDDGTQAPTLDATTKTTDPLTGTVTFTYTAGGQPGIDEVIVYYSIYGQVIASDYVSITAQ